MKFKKLQTLLRKAGRHNKNVDKAEWKALTASTMLGQRKAALSALRAAKNRRKFFARLDLEHIKTDGVDEDLQQAGLRQLQHQQDHAKALSDHKIKNTEGLTIKAYRGWTKARKMGDFSLVAPAFQNLLDRMREVGAAKAERLNLRSAYDGLLHEYEPFHAKQALPFMMVDLLAWLPEKRKAAIAKQAEHADEVAGVDWTLPADIQRELCQKILIRMKFDFIHNHQAETEHALTLGQKGSINLGLNYDTQDFTKAILSTVHEAGHALYRQNMPESWKATVAAGPASSAIDEATALIMERYLGQSRGFAEFVVKVLKEDLDLDRPDLTAERLYHKLNRINPDLERGAADEVSYPLHVILRYQLAKAMINDDLQAEALPAAWHAAEQEVFGEETENDVEGCLQDFHWYVGRIGYFPSYLTGALMAAQLFDTAVQADPKIAESVDNFDPMPLTQWLKDNVYAAAALKDLNDLMRDVTGAPLGTDAFKKRIESHYLPQPVLSVPEQEIVQEDDAKPKRKTWGQRLNPKNWLSGRFGRKGQKDQDAAPAPKNKDRPKPPKPGA